MAAEVAITVAMAAHRAAATVAEATVEDADLAGNARGTVSLTAEASYALCGGISIR